MSMQRTGKLAFLAVPILLTATQPSNAEVNFGKNVRIGGHDFSNKSYGRVEIEETTRRPPWYGCRKFPEGTRYEGKWYAGPIEICNLKKIPYDQRNK